MSSPTSSLIISTHNEAKLVLLPQLGYRQNQSRLHSSTMIENMMEEGELVLAEVIVELLQHAMQESGNDKFLIDGFPMSEENRTAFEDITGMESEFVLYFDCSEEEMEKQILGINQRRADDNIAELRKRFKVSEEECLPVMEYYESIGKVHKEALHMRFLKKLKPYFPHEQGA